MVAAGIADWVTMRSFQSILNLFAFSSGRQGEPNDKLSLGVG
jgi:hypothetical protein